MNKQNAALRKDLENQRKQFSLEKSVTCANYMLDLCISEQLLPQVVLRRLTSSPDNSAWGSRFTHLTDTAIPLEFTVACQMLLGCAEVMKTGAVRMGHIAAEYGDNDEIKVNRHLVVVPSFGGAQ